MEITEYGHRPFVEGLMEDFTISTLLYFYRSLIPSMIIFYFVKQKEKNKVDEDGR